MVNGAPVLDFTRPIDIENMPASLRLSMPSDPARIWPGAPPFFGEELVPHIYTTAGYVGSAARAYPIEDECLRNSTENSERMRTEPAIRECIEARQRAVSGLTWHLQAEDDSDPRQRMLVDQCTKVLRRTSNFLDMRMWLMEAIWLGRSAVFNYYKSMPVGHNRYQCISDWEPRHGDKLMFRYSDGTTDYKRGQLGIRVHATWAMKNLPAHEKNRAMIEATQYGLVRWFDDDERSVVVVHKHMLEDGPWQDPRALGRINGVGIRDRIYYTWLAMTAVETDLLTFLSRAALGVRLWRYPSGNPEWKKNVESAAKAAMQNNMADILFPVEPNEFSNQYGVEQLEPGLGGAQMLVELIEQYYLHRIKRYILGQTSTSESGATGMGSGIAEAHLATFADIITYDATKLSETITRELVQPLIARNWPEMAGCWVQFILNTENADAQRLLQMNQIGWSLGLPIAADQLYTIMGAKKPTASDHVLINPQIALGELQLKQGVQQMQMAEMQMKAQQASMPSQPNAEPKPIPTNAPGAEGTPISSPTEQPVTPEPVSKADLPDSMSAKHRVDGPIVAASPSEQVVNQQPQSGTLSHASRLLTPQWIAGIKDQIARLVA